MLLRKTVTDHRKLQVALEGEKTALREERSARQQAQAGLEDSYRELEELHDVRVLLASEGVLDTGLDAYTYTDADADADAGSMLGGSRGVGVGDRVEDRVGDRVGGDGGAEGGHCIGIDRELLAAADLVVAEAEAAALSPSRLSLSLEASASASASANKNGAGFINRSSGHSSSTVSSRSNSNSNSPERSVTGLRTGHSARSASPCSLGAGTHLRLLGHTHRDTGEREHAAPHMTDVTPEAVFSISAIKKTGSGGYIGCSGSGSGSGSGCGSGDMSTGGMGIGTGAGAGAGSGSASTVRPPFIAGSFSALSSSQGSASTALTRDFGYASR